MSRLYCPSLQHLWENATNVQYNALTTDHSHLGVQHGNASKYHTQVCSFAGMNDPGDTSNWHDLASLLRGDEWVILSSPQPLTAPSFMRLQPISVSYRFLGDNVEGQFGDNHIRLLHEADVPHIMELFTLSRPGPFAAKTITMGNFFGYFHEEQLIAVAGQRFSTPDFIEISGVSTHPHYTGKGIATTLIKHVIADIQLHNKIPFLHAKTTNTRATSLYEHLGFTLPHTVHFTAVSVA